jgi:deoxycytidine triphosphate deaminase
LVLQSCRNLPKVVAGLCTGKSTTLSGDVLEGVNINVEVTGMDIKVEEISVVEAEEDTFIGIKKEEIPVVKFMEETAINIKVEEIPWDVTSPTVKAEEDQVSYTCVCPLLDIFYENSIMPAILSSPAISVFLSWPCETSAL